MKSKGGIAMKKIVSSFKFFDLLPFVGVLVVERRKIIYANKATERIFGWSVEKLSQASLSLLFSKETYGLFLEPLSQVEKGEFEAMQVDFPCRRADGEEFYCVLSLSAGSQSGQIIISADLNSSNSAQDYLTGLYNRRAFFVLANHEIKAAKRFEREVYIVSIDADGLKIVNDRLGHQIGDELLVAVADILRASFRTSDVIARFGGDEFFVLASADLGTKDKIIERLKVQTRQKGQEFLAKYGYRISLSVGMARCGPEQSLQSAIEAADALMYEEKKKKKR